DRPCRHLRSEFDDPEFDHPDGGVRPELARGLLRVGPYAAAFTGVEDPREPLLVVVGRPARVAVAGERRPRGLHPRAEFDRLLGRGAADQIPGQTLGERTEDERTVEAVAGAEHAAEGGAGPG